MSLCYYCSAGMAPNSRAMFIESGVETENLERAEEAIYSQLHALQRGDLTEEELLSAQLALQNSLRSGDGFPACYRGPLPRPAFRRARALSEESIQQLMSYTKEQVVEAARRLRPAVVYTLKGGGVHEAEG